MATDTSVADVVYKLKELADLLVQYPLIGMTGSTAFNEEAIDLFCQLSEEMEENRYKKNVGHLTGSYVGIVGGSLSITGVALLPVTFSTSVGLIFAGAAVSTIGAGITLGFTLDKFFKDKRRKRLATPSIETFYRVRQYLIQIVLFVDITSRIVDSLEGNLKLLKKTIAYDVRKIDFSIQTIRVTQHLGASLLDTVQHVAGMAENLLQHTEDVLNIHEMENARQEFLDKINSVRKYMDPKEQRSKFKRELTTSVLRLLPMSGYDNYANIVDLTKVFFTTHHHLDKENGLKPKCEKGNSVPASRKARGVTRAMNVCFTCVKCGAIASRLADGPAKEGTATSQVVQVGETIATVGNTAVEVTKGMTVVGILFGALGVAFDAALVGFAIHDIIRGGKETFSQALSDMAEIMENTNKLLQLSRY